MSPLLLTILAFCPATLAERDGFTVCYHTANQRAIWTAHQSNPSAAPPADVPESEDTALTSNGIAQNPRLNRGDWRSLENQIRKQKPVQVITGATYNDCYIYKIATMQDGQILAHFAQNAESRARWE